jgi:hypothetical protein
MVKQDGGDPVAKCEPHPIVENGRGPLDHGPELGVAVCAVELPVIVVVAQKRSVDQAPIIDAGFEEIRERTPWEHGRAIVHLSGLRNMFSYGD